MSEALCALCAAMADDDVHDEVSGSEAEDSDDDPDAPDPLHFGLGRPQMRRCLSEDDVSQITSAVMYLMTLRTTLNDAVKTCVKTVPLDVSMISARTFCGAIICASGNTTFAGKRFSTALDLPTEMRRVAMATRMYCEYATTWEEQLATFLKLLELCKTEEGKMIVDIMSSMKPNQMNRASQAATALSAAARFAKVAPRGMPPMSDDELFAVPVARAPAATAVPAADAPPRKRTKRAVSPPVPTTTPEPVVTEDSGI